MIVNYRKIGHYVCVKLETGDDILGAVREICDKEQIKAAVVTGIGGLQHVEVGVWGNAAGRYHTKTGTDPDMEMTALVGNVTTAEGRSFPHLHATIADSTHHVFGGHLLSGIVQNMAELWIEDTGAVIEKTKCGPWFQMNLSKEG